MPPLDRPSGTPAGPLATEGADTPPSQEVAAPAHGTPTLPLQVYKGAERGLSHVSANIPAILVGGCSLKAGVEPALTAATLPDDRLRTKAPAF